MLADGFSATETDAEGEAKLLAALRRYAPDEGGEAGGRHTDLMGYAPALGDRCKACRREYEAAIGA